MRKVALALALSSLSLAVHAADLGIANSFNVFVFGNASTQGGHTDGAIGVGGSWTGSHDLNQHSLPATVGALTNIGGYVGGSMNFTGGSVNGAANLYIGGGFSGSINMNGGTRFSNSALVDPAVFTTQKTYSQGQANAIRGLTATNIAGLIGDPNNLNINVANLPAVQDCPNLKVLRMDGSLNQTFQNLQVNFLNQGADTVIIDVVGSSVDWRWKMNSSAFNHVLWSFADASTLRIANDSFRGSILAPNAHLTQERNIEGNVIANQWTLNNSVEAHFGSQFKFDGCAPVPEPGTMVALATGGLALLARRRRKA